MRNSVTKLALLSVAAGSFSLATPALSAEEEVTPLERQTEIQENAPSEIQGQQQDQLIATVGEGEIHRSDVMQAITGLPPRAQQTPPEMLFPAVLDQLITRELIMQEARAQNLQEDPEVKELAQPQSDAAVEQAMVQVWISRKVADRITDEQVQATVDKLKSQNPDLQETPGLTQQVKQALQVQAIADISDELRKDAEVTFYGAAGEPVEAQVGQGAEAEQQQQSDETETGEQSEQQ